MSLVIYAAGPIDLGKDIPNWRQELMKRLEERGVSAVMFDPSSAYKLSSWGLETNLSRSRYIEDINRQALELSTVFVVCIPKAVPSVGTPIELDFASGGGKQIFLLTDINPGKSVYVDNRVPVSNWFQLASLSDPEELQIVLASLAERLANLEFNKMEMSEA